MWKADENTLEGMTEKAEFLFQLLDDIDTTADMAKSDREAYFQQVERIHKRRFEAATTDGYSIFWDKREIPPPEPVEPSEPPRS